MNGGASRGGRIGFEDNFLRHASRGPNNNHIGSSEQNPLLCACRREQPFKGRSLKEAALHGAGSHGGKETPDETWSVKALGSKGMGGVSAGMYFSDVEKWHLKKQAVYDIDCPSFSTSCPAFVAWSITGAASGKG